MRRAQAFEPFSDIYPPFQPFRDAIDGACTFQLTILDCLKGMEKSMELGWYDWNRPGHVCLPPAMRSYR